VGKICNQATDIDRWVLESLHPNGTEGGRSVCTLRRNLLLPGETILLGAGFHEGHDWSVSLQRPADC
jgi:hypothetical protein